MVHSVNVFIFVENRVTIEDISGQLAFLWVQHTQLCMMTLSFGHSVVIGFHYDNARHHTAVRTVETIS